MFVPDPAGLYACLPSGLSAFLPTGSPDAGDSAQVSLMLEK
jgi:hypothetical protein